MIKFVSYRRSRAARLGVSLLAGATVLGTVGAVAGAAAGSTARAAKPVYYIAYEGPLSGGNAQLGLNMKFAVELAINQANAGKTFGSLPFTLKYTEEDDQGTAAQSPTAAQAIVTNNKIVAVVGPAFSGATAAAEPTFSGAHVATVSPSATNPKLSTEGWTNFFRVVPNDNVQGPTDAIYINKALKPKSVTSIDDASDYGAGIVQAVDARLQADNINVTHQSAPGTTQCQSGTGDVSEYPSLATSIASANPSLVFYGGYYCDLANLAKALRAAGYQGQIMSDDGALDPHYIADAGASVANGTLISCPCVVSTSGPYATFAKLFKALAGFPVGTYSPEAYDATNTIIDVMKSLGSHISRSAIVAGLHKVTYVGLTKTIKFTSVGEISGRAIDLYQVKSGKISLLGLIPKLLSGKS